MKVFAYGQTSKPTISKLLRPENITKIRSIEAGVQPPRSGGGGQVDEEGARRGGPREGGITGEISTGRESQEARYAESIKARFNSEDGNTDIHTGSVRGNTLGAPYPFSALFPGSVENVYGHPPSCQGPETVTLVEGLRVQGEEEHGNGRGLGAGLMQVTSMHEAQGHGMVCLCQTTTSLSHHK